MSGAPKRLQEEGGHSTPLKRPHEESSIYSSPSGKLIPPVGSEFHLPLEHGLDGRFAKVQRVESRDDKRPSLLHRIPSASINSLDHAISSDRNNKDARDTKTADKESKSEIRDLYNDTKMGPQNNKVENDVRLDGRGDENEPKHDKRSLFDYKVDIRFEKDSHRSISPHLNWKDSKEHLRGKIESWHLTRPSLHKTHEAPIDLSTTEEQRDTHETLGENKVDLRGEEKFRDKDRKRKDEKHRDFGDKDKDRIDRRTNTQYSSASIEHKDLQREDKDVERLERERKDSQRDKERIEREKDSIKRESSNVASEKENFHIEKEITDGFAKNSEHENTLEYKKLKDDLLKAHDRDYKDKKRERDVDVGDSHEQRSKYNDKEPDDGCAEGDKEKDKEVLVGVQQHRRMLRSRGTPQASQREPRFRSRMRSNDGSQGKGEVSAIVYKAGECMQELLKSWKEFEASQDPKNIESLQNGPTLEIRVPAEYVTSTNRQVKGAQLWGTDVYTNDSDLVAVLMHTGYCCPTSLPPPSAIQELHATVRVLPPQDCYTSTLRNNVRSRAWGAGIGCSFCIERCCIVKQKGGGTVELEPHLTHTSAMEPTLAPVSVERTVTTRAAASNALRQQRFVREVTIQYNLCNEPWLKYCISIVADKGLKKPLYTSARLKKGEVLYLETHFNRYELCFNGEKAACNGTISSSSQAADGEKEKIQNNSSHNQNGERNWTDREELVDVFRWSRCKKAMPEKFMRSIGIPLPVEHLEVLEANLDWEDVQWSQTGVWVAGKEYALARVHFCSLK
ncbi:zinc finger CCCH domain-containing protein 13-like isoform X3 [Ananas comosus]|uniref:Zinc finger CCCH domain-containing protein 13-like isoform X3 n=1 Tax=Ananas comosus TaxID=4615 RepID=A0A6P5GK76_ANACO|nr:zinc finger CCCH domain-containing protein 13-like isoform X3 [Ananas comosus]